MTEWTYRVPNDESYRKAQLLWCEWRKKRVRNIGCSVFRWLCPFSIHIYFRKYEMNGRWKWAERKGRETTTMKSIKVMWTRWGSERERETRRKGVVNYERPTATMQATRIVCAPGTHIYSAFLLPNAIKWRCSTRIESKQVFLSSLFLPIPVFLFRSSFFWLTHAYIVQKDSSWETEFHTLCLFILPLTMCGVKRHMIIRRHFITSNHSNYYYPVVRGHTIYKKKIVFTCFYIYTSYNIFSHKKHSYYISRRIEFSFSVFFLCTKAKIYIDGWWSSKLPL